MITTEFDGLLPFERRDRGILSNVKDNWNHILLLKESQSSFRGADIALPAL